MTEFPLKLQSWSTLSCCPGLRSVFSTQVKWHPKEGNIKNLFMLQAQKRTTRQSAKKTYTAENTNIMTARKSAYTWDKYLKWPLNRCHWLTAHCYWPAQQKKVSSLMGQRLIQMDMILAYCSLTEWIEDKPEGETIISSLMKKKSKKALKTLKHY